MRRKIVIYAVIVLMFAPGLGALAKSQSVNLSIGGEYKVGKKPVSIATADFNQDGNLDLAIANKKSNNVVILKGNGKGEFKKVREMKSVVNPTSIIVGDFNGDGDKDIAVKNSGNIKKYDHETHYKITNAGVSIFYGFGSKGIKFKEFENAIKLKSPVNIAAQDLNGDGISDIVVTDLNGNKLEDKSYSFHVYQGDAFKFKIFQGTDKKGKLVRKVSKHLGGEYFVGGSIPGIITGDLNNNGSIDISLYTGGGSFRFFDCPGSETGEIECNKSTFFKNGLTGSHVTTGDFNGDGLVDVVSATIFNPMKIAFGQGDGSFDTPKGGEVGHVYGGVGNSIISTDINDDSFLDVAVTISKKVKPTNMKNVVSVVLGDGTGAFSSAIYFSVGKKPQGLVSGDFNNDGKIDLAVANNRSNSITILLGE